ncbi:hypothetical protein B0H14DRAFT_3566039 [Mycena olivaceomarginata]|nr:hypothetical protein B0H14DRAFT_3566039 [Mycena olivaceomarginata]
MGNVPDPVLAVAHDALDSQDALQLWSVFSMSKNSLQDDQRLENISRRLAFRDLHRQLPPGPWPPTPESVCSDDTKCISTTTCTSFFNIAPRKQGNKEERVFPTPASSSSSDSSGSASSSAVCIAVELPAIQAEVEVPRVVVLTPTPNLTPHPTPPTAPLLAAQPSTPTRIPISSTREIRLQRASTCLDLLDFGSLGRVDARSARRDECLDQYLLAFNRDTVALAADFLNGPPTPPLVTASHSLRRRPHPRPPRLVIRASSASSARVPPSTPLSAAPPSLAPLSSAPRTRPYLVVCASVTCARPPSPVPPRPYPLVRAVACAPVIRPHHARRYSAVRFLEHPELRDFDFEGRLQEQAMCPVRIAFGDPNIGWGDLAAVSREQKAAEGERHGRVVREREQAFPLGGSGEEVVLAHRLGERGGAQCRRAALAVAAAAARGHDIVHAGKPARVGGVGRCGGQEEGGAYGLVGTVGQLSLNKDKQTYLALRETLIDRSTCDKESTIRAQAVSAPARLVASKDPSELQEGEKSIIDVLLDVMALNPAADIRHAALLHVPLTAATLPALLARTRDADPAMHRAVLRVPMPQPNAQPDNAAAHPQRPRAPRARRSGRGGQGRSRAEWFELILAEKEGVEEGDNACALLAFLELFDVDLWEGLEFGDDYHTLTPKSAVPARVRLEWSLASEREDGAD